MSDRMEEITRADQLLAAAEAGVRDLIQQCLERDRYMVVAVLAELADGIASIRRRAENAGTGGLPHETSTMDREFVKGTKSDVVRAVVGGSARSRQQAVAIYPRFEREGDRLVKVGWSKKDRREYEHKAPRPAVNAICAALAKRGKGAATLTMETLLPVTDADGRDVPSYQAYLVVAWLRQLEVVERTGKDAYSVKVACLTDKEIDESWSHLPKYEAKV